MDESKKISYTEFLLNKEIPWALDDDLKAMQDIVYEWMKPMLDHEGILGLWLDRPTVEDGFEWTLINDVDFQGPMVGVRTNINDDGKKGYELYQYLVDQFIPDKYINIKIFDDLPVWVENENTTYKDFTREQMYELFERISKYYEEKRKKNETDQRKN